MFVLHCCRYMARSFTFILPYFPTGTMERVDTEGQVATAKVSTCSQLTIYILTCYFGFSSMIRVRPTQFQHF